MQGRPFHNNSIGEQFVNHFKNVMGRKIDVSPISNPKNLFFKKISCTEAANMARNVTDEEIKAAIFDIDGNKALGPDGYSSQFF
ncbi:hypothetical protein Tco_0021095 [Tanacetum coccineum]